MFHAKFCVNYTPIVYSVYLRRTKKRKKGFRRGSRERIEKGSREGIVIERKETKVKLTV